MKPNAGKLAIMAALVAMLSLLSPTDVAFAAVNCTGYGSIDGNEIRGTIGPDIIDCRDSTADLVITAGDGHDVVPRGPCGQGDQRHSRGP